MIENNLFSYFVLFSNILNVLFSILIIFYERKNIGSTMAWLMVMAIVPYFGFVLYLIFGLDARNYAFFNEKYEEDTKIYEQYKKLPQVKAEPEPPLDFFDNKNKCSISELLYLNSTAGYGALTEFNDIDAFFNGKEKFEALINDIENARQFVHIQYYIVRNDNLGKRIVEALKNAADRGVEVKFIIDGMGCQFTSKKLFAPLKNAGGKLGIFIPPALVRINYRNHRKICVIDGTIAYVGGLNIGDEYLGNLKKYGPWRDSHIRITGEAVKQLELRFIMDWNFCSADKIEMSEKYIKNEILKDSRIYTQIVSSGPDTKWPIIKYSYLKMISSAEKNIYIESPYFVPDDSIFEMLKIQALAGIDVKIVIPANPDHPFVYGAAISYLGRLMEAGVRCYLYRKDKKNKGFTHSKILMIDGEILSVGTANMDIRSFELNFEINAFIYDKTKTREFEKNFLENLSDCMEIDLDWYARRSIISKIKESVSRLLSPLI